MAKRQAKKVLTKKKKWIPIIANYPYEGHVIGETYVTEPNTKIGTKMKVSLAGMTGEHSRQNLQLKFIVSNFKEGALRADLVGTFMLQTTLKKLVKKRKDKIDLSFKATTKDKKPIRIKFLLMTRNRTTGVVITNLIKRIIFRVNKVLGLKTYSEFVKGVLNRSFQKDLQNYLKKTYPIAICEIRSFEVLTTEDLKLEAPKKAEEPASVEKSEPKKKVVKKVAEQETSPQ